MSQLVWTILRAIPRDLCNIVINVCSYKKNKITKLFGGDPGKMAHSSIPSRRVRQFLSVTARKKILSLNRLFSFLTRKLELVCLSRFPRWDSIPEMLRE